VRAWPDDLLVVLLSGDAMRPRLLVGIQVARFAVGRSCIERAAVGTLDQKGDPDPKPRMVEPHQGGEASY